MKTELQELIDAANSLCDGLERASQQEKQFCVDMCIALENYSYEVFKTANNIKELQQKFGG